jgi:hypothetical protein
VPSFRPTERREGASLTVRSEAMAVVNRWRASDFERPTVEDVLAENVEWLVPKVAERRPPPDSTQFSFASPNYLLSEYAIFRSRFG